VSSKSDLAKARNRAKMQAMADALNDVKSPANMKKYGQMVADMIRLRTRLGDGVAREGADKGKLKKLAKSTITSREALQKKGKLSELTSPGKSNLTRTGQLLDSESVKSVSVGKVTVGPTGTRDDGKTNAEVAEYVSQQRPYNHLSRVETKRVNDAVKKDIRALIKSRLTKTK
jgi:hypothetical protein